jgi:polyhydroxyalkanoate synthase
VNKSNTKGLDLARLSDLMIKFSDKQQNVASAMAKKKGGSSSVKADIQVLGDFTEATARLMADPETMFKVQQSFVKDYTAAGKKFMENLFFPNKKDESEKVKDKRFKSEEWKKNPYFELLRDLYLINAKNLNQAVSEVKGLDPRSKKRVEFFTNQFTDAMSPSNFLMTNPELLKLTMESGGENIIDGFDKFLNDVNCEDGNLNIRISDPDAFELGKNVGTTKGSVVFQNDILQLIQYEPRTEKVFKTPVLISPPFINKYYILDINEKNSMVKWLVDQGYTVFMISWVNPGKEHAHKQYEDYVMEGHLEVLDVIKKITRQPKVSAIGYCTGGTLLATTAAYLEAQGEDRFASITYMATLMDFSEPGDLGNFLDENQVNQIIEDIKEVGYLDGRHLAKTFNMLKPNDLVWSYAVDKYLKGNEPVPFDILFWNSDSTNLPAEMYSFYLKNMYIENRFKDPGGISINGVDIDLGRITAPTYFLTTEDDHIVLWKASYKGALLHSGKKRFVLGGSGHVAGVANPPFKNKYWYRWSDDIKDTPEEWLETASYEDGSWWIDWHDWNLEFAGNMVNKRVPGKGKFKEIEPAPGSYAKKTIDKKVKCRENCSCHKESRKGITRIQSSMPGK